MAHSRRSLKLTENWDLCLDGMGRIGLSLGETATAQNVANETRLFTQDAYFNQDLGLPHFLVDLGQRAKPALLRSYLRQAALNVPDVKEVLAVKLDSPNPETRALGGDIRFRTAEGEQESKLSTYF